MKEIEEGQDYIFINNTIIQKDPSLKYTWNTSIKGRDIAYNIYKQDKIVGSINKSGKLEMKDFAQSNMNDPSRETKCPYCGQEKRFEQQTYNLGPKIDELLVKNNEINDIKLNNKENELIINIMLNDNEAKLLQLYSDLQSLEMSIKGLSVSALNATAKEYLNYIDVLKNDIEKQVNIVNLNKYSFI